jgi:predicted lipid-binding transport protein (Tim44 family)
VNTALETKDLSKLQETVLPELLSVFEARLQELTKKKQLLQKRNLAVRNVEIVLVQNRNDKNKDEFTAWVSGQYQQVLIDEKTEKVIRGDSFVHDFDEYWCFQRKQEKWLLKSIEIGFKGKEFLEKESQEEGASKEMMDWYYSKERAN